MKTLWSNVGAFFASVFGVLAPVAAIIYTLTFIIFLDFIFGIVKSVKLKQEVSSRKMSQSISKVFLYNLLIIGLFVVDKYILQTGIGLEKIGASLIILVEIRSIDEHFTKLFGYSLWDKISEQFKRGKSITK
jgi:phage-related holin